MLQTSRKLATPRDRIFRSSGIWAGLLTAAVDGFAAAMVIPLLPGLAEGAGAAPGTWVLILGVNGALLTLAPLIWGRVISPRNTPVIVAGTLLVKAVCMAALCLPQSFALLLLNRALSGAMCGTPIAVQSAMVWDASEGRGPAFSIAWFNIATAVGFAVGPILAALVLRHQLGFETLALMTSGALAALAVLGLAAFPRQSNVAAPIGAQPATGSIRKRYIGVLAIVAGSRTASSAFPVLLLMTAEQSSHGLSMSLVAVLVGWISLVEMLSQVIVPFVIRRRGLFAVNLAALCTLAAGLALVAVTLSPVSAAVATMLVGLGGGALRTSMMNWVLELGAGEIARSAGANFGVNGAARALAPVAAGALFQLGAPVAFAIVAVLPPLLVVMALFSRPRPERPIAA